MEEALIQRLQKSFNLLAPRGPELVDRFYAHLFAKHPGLRELFPDDMSGQKKKLLASLVLVIQNLRNAERLRPALLDLGRRHAGYKAEPGHYPAVRDTLVQVMGEMASEQWNNQLTADWNAALNLVADIMLEGHELEKQPAPSSTKNAS